MKTILTNHKDIINDEKTIVVDAVDGIIGELHLQR
jgi:hypothetical protein